MAIYKRSRGVELGTTVKQLQLVVRTGLNQQPEDFKSGALTNRPSCLHIVTEQDAVKHFEFFCFLKKATVEAEGSNIYF